MEDIEKLLKDVDLSGVDQLPPFDVAAAEKGLSRGGQIYLEYARTCARTGHVPTRQEMERVKKRLNISITDKVILHELLLIDLRRCDPYKALECEIDRVLQRPPRRPLLSRLFAPVADWLAVFLFGEKVEEEEGIFDE